MDKLNTLERAFILKKVPVFEDLNLETLLAIAEKTEQSVYEPGALVFKENDSGNRVFILVEGALLLGSTLLRPYLLFGEESVFNKKSRQYSAQAKEKTCLLHLSETHFLQVVQECPEVALRLLQKHL